MNNRLINLNVSNFLTWKGIMLLTIYIRDSMDIWVCGSCWWLPGLVCVKVTWNISSISPKKARGISITERLPYRPLISQVWHWQRVTIFWPPSCPMITHKTDILSLYLPFWLITDAVFRHNWELVAWLSFKVHNKPVQARGCFSTSI